MNEDKTIYTDDKKPIYWLEKDYKHYLDKTTLIFGGSGSGKTTIIEEILYLCSDYIPCYLVIAPKTSNHAYRDKLPDKCIKEDLSKRKLQQIWARQSNITNIYNIANDIEVLKRLFLKANIPSEKVKVDSVERATEVRIRDIENDPNLNFAMKKSKKSVLENMLKEKLVEFYKSTIKRYYEHLNVLDLQDDERVALTNLDINPRFMIIIDDSSEKFKGWMKLFKKPETNVFESIFYRGRWNFITLVFAAHDDKIVDTELRKNARITIFTNSSALNASLNKVSSGYGKKEKEEIANISNKIFANEEIIKTNQKFCNVREDPKPFRYTIADCYPNFKLGSKPFVTLLSKIPTEKNRLQDNPFLKDILNKKKFNF